MGTRIIYLVRHGQEDRERRLNELGGVLSETGLAQARATAEYLQDVKLHAAYASTLHRASETLDLIAACHPDLPVEKTDALWECVPTVPDILQNMIKDLSQEKISAEQERIATAFDRFFTPPTNEEDRRELIVCHGNLIRYFICRILETPADMWVNIEIANCGISRVEVRSNGRIVLVTHNEHQHIPPQYLTYI